MIKTAVVLLPTLWTEKPTVDNSVDADLQDLINKGYRIKIMNDFECNGVCYTHYVLEKEEND